MCHGRSGEAEAETATSANDLEPLFANDRLRTGPRLTRTEVGRVHPGCVLCVGSAASPVILISLLWLIFFLGAPL